MLQKLGALFLVAILLSSGCVSSKQARTDEPNQAGQDQPQQTGQDAPANARPARHDQPAVVDSVAKRQMQSRIFDTQDEKMVLSASADVLKKLGFTLDGNHPAFGLVICSKDNSGKILAVKAGALVLGVGLALLTRGAVGVGANVAGAVSAPLFDTVNTPMNTQYSHASLVATPVGEKGERVLVRLILRNVVRNSDNSEIIAAQLIEDPKLYQEFFDKLSQSISLEAHGL